MQVTIELGKEVSVGSSGVQFAVAEPNGRKHFGNCWVTMTVIKWGKGKKRKNAVSIKWEEFAQIMASNDAKKAAIKAAQQT